jgi:hypothetical protein
MNKKMKSWKLLTIILIGLISITIATGTAQGHLVQGQVNQNGTLWFISYQTPSGTQYPSPFDSFHANNLTLTVYSPLTSVQTAHIAVSGTQGNTTRWLNQTLTVMPHQVQSFALGIPAVQGQQLVSIEWENNTVSYYISTFQPVQFPFGNNPLGLLALIGVIMLIFTALNIGATKALIERAKYFPAISQRVWIGIFVLTGLILYSIYTGYYYDLTGQDWAIWLIPLWFFNLLMILGSWKGKEQNELYIHVRRTAGSDVETGLYAVKTAPMTEEEKGKYPNVNHSGKEYLDNRSYADFVKRLFGKHVPIIMDTEESPDNMRNVKVESIGKKALWKMKDKPSKNHPFSEAYLIDPENKPPSIERVQGETVIRFGKEHTKKYQALISRLNGVHMRQAEEFLAGYIAASDAGTKIHDLNQKLAKNQSELNIKAYDFQTETITHLIDSIGMHSAHPKAPATPDTKEADKGEGKP